MPNARMGEEMFNAGVLLAVVVGLAAIAAAVFYYGRLLQLGDASARNDADSDSVGSTSSPSQSLQGAYEAVEIADATAPGSEADGPRERVLGTYGSRAMAVLRVEATRQKHRRAGTTAPLWFYVRDVGTGKPVWFVDGIGRTRSDIEQDLQLPNARR